MASPFLDEHRREVSRNNGDFMAFFVIPDSKKESISRLGGKTASIVVEISFSAAWKHPKCAMKKTGSSPLCF